jgi:hypothetical protein
LASFAATAPKFRDAVETADTRVEQKPDVALVLIVLTKA